MSATDPEHVSVRVDHPFEQDFRDSILHISSKTINFGTVRDDDLLDAVVQQCSDCRM